MASGAKTGGFTCSVSDCLNNDKRRQGVSFPKYKKLKNIWLQEIFKNRLKDVRAHCYCASLVRTLFIGHARATSFSSARTDSKTQQNIERITFALTWCANIFVGSSVTPTFFSADHFVFRLFSSY